MERLTKRYVGGMAYVPIDDVNRLNEECVGLPITKLAEYEDAEEQGLLIRFPCKVGDTVYRICPKCSDRHNGSCTGCAWENSAGANWCLVYGQAGDKAMKCQIVPYKVSWAYIPSLMEDIGKTVFLTRKEAEEKLEELQKEGERHEQIS